MDATMRSGVFVLVVLCVLVGTSTPVAALKTTGTGPATATWVHHAPHLLADAPDPPEPVELVLSEEYSENGTVVTRVVTFTGVASEGSCQSTGPWGSPYGTVTGSFRHLGMTWRCTSLTIDTGWTHAWEACYWSPTIAGRTTPDFGLVKVEATFKWTPRECTPETTE